MNSMPPIPKKWRNLPKKERVRKCINYLNFDPKEIKNIQKIKDPKKKLIKSAKIQYEAYGDIHSYVTSWIAGYGSDSTIRQKFGSTKELLNLFYDTNVGNKNISPSWADIKRKIKIPKNISEDLAEEVGIHIGDGNLYISKDKNGFFSYRYSINGNLSEEIIYHEEYLQNLLKKLYNWSGFFSKRTNKNSIETNIKSKAILEYKNKELGLPIGPKKNIEIPKEILKDIQLAKRCLGGLFDTDFTVNHQMNLVGNLTCIKVIKQVHTILNKLKIKNSMRFIHNYGNITICREDSLKIMREGSLNNIKHSSKYELWKEFKEYVPFSKTEERLAVIKGILDLEDLKKICKKRKCLGIKKTFPAKPTNDLNSGKI